MTAAKHQNILLIPLNKAHSDTFDNQLFNLYYFSAFLMLILFN